MTFKELLKREDMTASQVARRIGVTKETVSNWVNNKSSPTARHICAIADKLQVSAEEVLKCFTVKSA